MPVRGHNDEFRRYNLNSAFLAAYGDTWLIFCLSTVPGQGIAVIRLTQLTIRGRLSVSAPKNQLGTEENNRRSSSTRLAEMVPSWYFPNPFPTAIRPFWLPGCVHHTSSLRDPDVPQNAGDGACYWPWD